MKKYQTIIFWDEELIFQANMDEKNVIILNYRMMSIPQLMKGIKVSQNMYYYEINLGRAFNIITNHKENEYNNLAKYCLLFLGSLLEESSDSLICFLQKETKLNRDELLKLELEFNTFKSKIHSSVSSQKIQPA